MTETRYLVPAGADWAVWDDVNGIMAFMTDARPSRTRGRTSGSWATISAASSDPTPKEAWAYVRELWSGDPGGRGWQLRVPFGATWVALREDGDYPAPDGPGATFGFGEPPLDEGSWVGPGY